jgi:hypothetical protein
MFLKENGPAAILLAIVFMSLGFILGKVTGHQGGHRGCKSAASCHHSSPSCNKFTPPPPVHCKHAKKEGGDHLIIVESMIEDGFEGDTVLNIPGGSIQISIDGDDVDVKVDVEDIIHGDHK